MKVRKGFVSNSSSSSFLIYGAFFERSEFKEILLKKLNNLGETSFKDMNSYDLFGELCKKVKTSLELEIISDDCFYLGKSWDKVSDNETGKQFKDSIEKEIKKLFDDENIKCYTYQQAWYDG